MTTIQIETSTRANFEAKFNLFAKKVAKMGLEKPTFSYGETSQREKLIVFRCEGEESQRLLMLEVVDVNLHIDASYKMNGWELVSVVLFQKEVVLPIDLNSVPPTELGLKYTKCDHCGGNHPARKKSFIVRNETTFKQVGSTCSKEFLGMSERLITNMQVMFSELIEARFTDGSEDWDSYGSKMGRDNSWLDKYNALELVKVMSVIIPEVSEFGYEKQKFAQVQVTDQRGRTCYDDYGNIQYQNDYTRQLNIETATINKITPKIEAGIEDSEIDFSDFTEYVNGLKLKTRTVIETQYESVKISDDNFIEEIKQFITEGKFETVEYNGGFDSSLCDIETVDYMNFPHNFRVSGWEINYDYVSLTASCTKYPHNTSKRTAVKCTFKSKEVVTSEIIEDFNFKLRQVVNQKMVMKKDLSVLSAGYASFVKFKSTPEAKFVGIAGEKHNLTLTITDIKTGNGMYGEWTLYSMVDAEGNNFTKFGTINAKFSNSEDVKVGSVITAAFEIKEHKEFNMIKQTALGRLSKIK